MTRTPYGNNDTTGADRDLWKFDMHIHSRYSGDSTIDPNTIVEIYRKTGMLPLVCDHNSTAGSEAVYREIIRIAPEVPFILAEEIMTQEGEIIGLFLTEMIPPYLTAAETLDIIHDQGGLALVPHPFCSVRTNSALWRDTLDKVIGRVDIIEGFNSRTFYDRDNVRAREYAQQHDKPVSVGSDAHHAVYLGQYWLELEPFGSPRELIRSLQADTVRFPVLQTRRPKTAGSGQDSP